MSRVAVTGGAGFLGSHLCDHLVALGDAVVCLDDVSTGSQANVAHLLDSPRFSFVVNDVSRKVELASGAKVDAVRKGMARVVYGSRFTGERKNMMPLYWFANRILSLTTNLLHTSTLSDVETCSTLFDAQAIAGIAMVSYRFDFEPEITAKVLGRGHRIYEVPISCAGRATDEWKRITSRDSALVGLVRFRFTKES